MSSGLRAGLWPAIACEFVTSTSTESAETFDSGCSIGDRPTLPWGRPTSARRPRRSAVHGIAPVEARARRGPLPAPNASSPAPESAQPRSSLRPGASARSLKRTRRPSRCPFTSPTRSSACRCRVVQDCDSPIAAANSPTHRSATARALTNRKREDTPRQARTGRVWVSCKSDAFIAQRCISYLVIDRNDLALIVFA